MNRIRKLWQTVKALYQGARWSSSRSYIQGSYRDAHLDLTKATRTALAAKVRDFETDNGIIQKSADLSEQFVAGAGGMPVLAASSDSVWNVAAQAWWDQWCRMCDIASLQSFGTIQGLLVRTCEIDGEAFILKTYGSSGMPRIQLLEGHRIESRPDDSGREGKTPGVIDGIEVDSFGRPIGYWFREGDGNDAKYRMLDAATVIHYFEPSRIGQKRGVTPWHAAINDLIDLDDLQDLEMKAAKDAAEVSNVLTSETGEVNLASLRRELQSGTNQTSGGTSVTENRTKYVSDSIGGRSMALKIGEKLEQFRSDRPNVATQEYWDFLIGKICAARGVSKLLAFPYGRTQGTLVRAELDIAAGFYRCRSAVLADVLVQIWVYVMGTAIRRVPELKDAPKDWVKVWIIPPRSPNVDVGYNSAAMLAEWEAGAKPLRDICGPLGLNWREVIDQLAIEAAYKAEAAKRVGVEPSAIGKRGEPEPAQQPQPEEEVAA